MTKAQVYTDILKAVKMTCELNVQSQAHGFVINPPTRPGSYTLCINISRTVRSVWDGKLHYTDGVTGGSILYPKRVAKSLTDHYFADRELRARLLAERKPGIMADTFTHE